MSVPHLAEVFSLREGTYEEWREKFANALRRLASKNGGKLPVTHETSMKNWEMIKRSGFLGHPTEYYGNFAFLGHSRERRWTKGPGVLMHIDIPGNFIQDVSPDMRFGGDTDEAAYEQMFAESHTLEGLEVNINIERIPRSWWRRVLDNESLQEIQF